MSHCALANMLRLAAALAAHMLRLAAGLAADLLNGELRESDSGQEGPAGLLSEQIITALTCQKHVSWSSEERLGERGAA